MALYREGHNPDCILSYGARRPTLDRPVHVKIDRLLIFAHHELVSSGPPLINFVIHPDVFVTTARLPAVPTGIMGYGSYKARTDPDEAKLVCPVLLL